MPGTLFAFENRNHYIMIPLYLHQKGQLFQPILYLSGYFDQYRDKYIDALHEVDETGKFEEWIKFFLSRCECRHEKYKCL